MYSSGRLRRILIGLRFWALSNELFDAQEKEHVNPKKRAKTERLNAQTEARRIQRNEIFCKEDFLAVCVAARCDYEEARLFIVYFGLEEGQQNFLWCVNTKVRAQLLLHGMNRLSGPRLRVAWNQPVKDFVLTVLFHFLSRHQSGITVPLLRRATKAEVQGALQGETQEETEAYSRGLFGAVDAAERATGVRSPYTYRIPNRAAVINLLFGSPDSKEAESNDLNCAPFQIACLRYICKHQFEGLGEDPDDVMRGGMHDDIDLLVVTIQQCHQGVQDENQVLQLDKCTRRGCTVEYPQLKTIIDELHKLGKKILLFNPGCRTLISVPRSPP